MAYTVTYQRRTKSGKKVTVRRRVAGNKPTPGGPKKAGAKKAPAKKAPSRSVAAKSRSTKRYTAPKKTTARKAPVRKTTARKAPPSNARVSRKAPSRKAPSNASRIFGLGKKAAGFAVRPYAPGIKASRDLARDVSRGAKVVGRAAGSAAKSIGRTANKAMAGARRGSLNLAFGNASNLMKLEGAIRKARGFNPTAREIATRSALTVTGRRFSNAEQAAIVFGALTVSDKNTFNTDINTSATWKLQGKSQFTGK